MIDDVAAVGVYFFGLFIGFLMGRQYERNRKEKNHDPH